MILYYCCRGVMLHFCKLSLAICQRCHMEEKETARAAVSESSAGLCDMLQYPTQEPSSNLYMLPSVVAAAIVHGLLLLLSILPLLYCCTPDCCAIPSFCNPPQHRLNDLPLRCSMPRQCTVVLHDACVSMRDSSYPLAGSARIAPLAPPLLQGFGEGTLVQTYVCPLYRRRYSAPTTTVE